MQLRQRMTGGLAAAALALTLLTVGCSNTQQQLAPGPAPAASEGPVTPKVNRVLVALTPPATEANNLADGAFTQFFQLMPMYEYLLGVAPEGQDLQPQLATEWNLEPDGSSYRMKLRKGVKFHGGNGEMTAEDVRYNWEYRLKADAPPFAPGLKTVLGPIKDVEVVNDYEIVLRITTPEPTLFASLSQQENQFQIVSAKDGKSRGAFKQPSLTEKPIAGTGAYAYDSREQSRFLRYARVEGQHWRQTPDFPEIEYRWIKENSTRLAALLAKEIHIANVPLEMTDPAEKAGFKVVSGKSPGTYVLGSFYGVWMNKQLRPTEQLNPDPNQTYVFPDSPMMDVRVRKALNMAIDRDALNKAFVQGKGQPMYIAYFRPDRPGWNPEWQTKFKENYGYDPEAAKKLLAEAGYGPNKPLTTTWLQSPPRPALTSAGDMVEAIAGYWRKVGIDVKMNAEDEATRSNKLNRLVDVDSHNNLIVSGLSQFIGVGVYNSTFRSIRSGVQLKELDDIFREIARTMDPKKADELWRQWGNLAYQQHVNMPFYWLPAEVIVDPNIVADWVFPGSISGTYSHLEHIKAAR